ncbi:MerR family transcriptional regulator [Kocuria sp. KH4]
MRIGELAEATGVSARSLRYYEDQGLLRAHRTPAGHRRYTPGDVDRVVQIQQLYAAGLCSRVISELLPCLHAPPQERTGHLETRLAQEHQRLETAVREAVRARDSLEEVITDFGRP